MTSRNTNVKLVRGAGTIKLLSTLHDIRNMRQRPLNYKANNDEGTVMVKPDYTLKKLVPSRSEPDKNISVRVQWTPHTLAGMDGFLTDWKKFLADGDYNYPQSVAEHINDLRSEELMEVLNLAIDTHKALVSATTYNVNYNKQIKVYGYNGNESPMEHPVSKEVTYSNIRMGYMASWKQIYILNAGEAKEIKKWLTKNKLAMDLLLSMATMDHAKLTYARTLRQKEQEQHNMEVLTQRYNSFLADYDEQQTQYDEVVAWLSKAPMELGESGKHAVIKRFFTRKPSQLLEEHRLKIDRCVGRIKTADDALEAYSDMGWGEEE